MSTEVPRDRPVGQRSEVVLIGPIGAGKSTLAVLVAARLGLGDVPGGDADAADSRDAS